MDGIETIDGIKIVAFRRREIRPFFFTPNIYRYIYSTNYKITT